MTSVAPFTFGLNNSATIQVAITRAEVTAYKMEQIMQDIREDVTILLDNGHSVEDIVALGLPGALVQEVFDASVWNTPLLTHYGTAMTDTFMQHNPALHEQFLQFIQDLEQNGVFHAIMDHVDFGGENTALFNHDGHNGITFAMEHKTVQIHELFRANWSQKLNDMATEILRNSDMN